MRTALSAPPASAAQPIIISVCHRALDTVEILENILLYLPLKDLLISQRVCKIFQNTVKGSVKARRALFYEPMGEDFVCLPPSAERHPTYADEGRVWHHAKQPHTKVQPILNPMVPEFLLIQGKFRERASFLHYGFVNPMVDTITSREKHWMIDAGPKTKQRVQLLHRQDASWRNMLVMQPPCKALSFWCKTGKKRLVISAQDEGLTLQKVLDGLRGHWLTDPSCPQDGHLMACWDFEGGWGRQIEMLGDESLCGWDHVHFE